MFMGYGFCLSAAFAVAKLRATSPGPARRHADVGHGGLGRLRARDGAHRLGPGAWRSTPDLGRPGVARLFLISSAFTLAKTPWRRARSAGRAQQQQNFLSPRPRWPSAPTPGRQRAVAAAGGGVGGRARLLISGGAVLTMVAVRASAGRWILERASDGARASITALGHGRRRTSVATGTAITSAPSAPAGCCRRRARRSLIILNAIGQAAAPTTSASADEGRPRSWPRAGAAGRPSGAQLRATRAASKRSRCSAR